MKRIVLQLEHSVDANVSLEFAWKHRTDIANWNDPPASFVLDGPFIVGSRGTTMVPGQQSLHWIIGNVQPLSSFTIEMELDRAMLQFEWRFDALSERTTKMTQRIILTGENAEAFAEQIRAGFSPGLADGMKKIAAEMAVAQNKDGLES